MSREILKGAPYIQELPWGAMVIDFTGRILSVEGVVESYLSWPIRRHLSEFKEMEKVWKALLELKQRPQKETTTYLNLDGKYYKVVIISSHEAREDLYWVYFLDVTEFHEAEEELKKRNRQLITLNAIVTSFIEAQDSDPYNTVLEKILMLGEFDGGLIVLKKDDRWSVLARGGITLLTGHINERWFQELVPVEEMAMTIIEEEEILKYKVLKKEGFKFFAIVPIMIKGSIDGFICLAARRPMKAEFDLVTLLNFLGKNLSMLIERQVFFEEARRLSLTDPLTGLYNIRYFYEVIEGEVQRASRYGEVFSVVLFDIDNFKDVNDTYGHQAGDDVLREVAEILMSQSRSADTVARYGGEEFVMLLPRTDKDSAKQLAERIKEAVRVTTFCKTTVSINGKTRGIGITISGGLATFPEDGSTSRQLLYRADMALYRAKALGKARIVAE